MYIFALTQSQLIYIAYINLLWFPKNPTLFGDIDDVGNIIFNMIFIIY